MTPVLAFYLRVFNVLTTYFPRQKWLCHTYNTTNIYILSLAMKCKIDGMNVASLSLLRYWFIPSDGEGIAVFI
jgi:hypothetical protein